jgi:hypothetical protein
MTQQQTETRTVAEVLTDALARLRSGGWYPGYWYPQGHGLRVGNLADITRVLTAHPDLPCSAVGAVLVCCHGDLDLYEACCCLLAALVPQESAEDGYRVPLPTWQGLPGRTVAEVLDLLTEARDAATMRW